MSKALTANATIEKNKKNAIPINILKIEWGGGIGNKYYSDRALSVPVTTENESVFNWGNLSSVVHEDSGNSSSVTVSILDTSNTILGYSRAQEVYKKKCILYQWFDDTLLTDMFIIFTGTIKDVVRKEEPPVIEIVIENIELNYDKRIGTPADIITFPSIEPGQEGAILPLIIGKVERFTGAIQVIDSKRTSLVVPLKWNKNTAIVSDSKEFPQNTLIDLWIGTELVRGRFDGCKLTLIQRGKTIETGYTIKKSPNNITFIANLAPNGPNWIGKKVKVFTTGKQHKYTITNYTSPNIYACSGSFGFQLLGNTYFEIYSDAANHDTGTEVYEYKDSYTWIINDAPSVSVEKIEMKGSLFVEGTKKVDTWVKLHEDWQTTNLNDASYVGTLGHAVTSITMPFDPKNLVNGPFSDSTLYCSLTGVNYSNPVDMIVYLAKILGLSYPDDFDTTSETSVKAATNYLSFGITIKEKLTFDVLYDIAFQSRIGLSFSDSGKLVFKYLQNSTGTSAKTITNDLRQIDSLEILKPEQVFNKLYVSYFEDGKEKKFEIQDTVSIAKHGVREKSLNFWCHQQRYTAEAIANFWLRRWANALELCKFSTFLDSVEIQKNDWVTLNFTGFENSQIAEIIEINHVPGNQENIDKIEFVARLPKFAGCASSCEQYEQTGCASSCQQYCTLTAQVLCGYSCETSAQDACSLSCVSACELFCTTYVENFNPQSCIGQCQIGCVTNTEAQPGCSLGCQAASCTTGEQGCGTSFMVSGFNVGAFGNAAGNPTGACWSSCMSSCTSGCTVIVTAETDGQGGACAIACQGACTAGGCTTSCESGCTTGAEACQNCCQYACTTKCQESCQQGSCRSGCTASVTARSFSMCLGNCETGCRGACENKCQSCCQYDGTETSYKCASACQTGCVQNCETSAQSIDPGWVDVCFASCQGWCMSNGLQTGCAMYCTVGCRCSCTGSCQGTSCTTSCEISCQCQCQTSTEAHCTGTSNETCWLQTQSACASTSMTDGCDCFCQAFCMQNEQTGCAMYCTVGCRCSCTGSCQGTSCTTNCEISCQCQCQTSTESSCNISNEVCFSSAQGACATQSMTSGCNYDCQAYCMSNSQVGCAIYCTGYCRCNCTISCTSESCTASCEIACICQCQTSGQTIIWGCCQAVCQVSTQAGVWQLCGTSCRLSCTTNCTDFCRINAQNACSSQCQAWCMSNSQVGCNIYCTIGCRCDCMILCESNCTTDCQQYCRCDCQSSTMV